VSEPSTVAEAWRTQVGAILLHPSLPKALVLRGPAGLALPDFELPGRLWTGKPQRFVGGVRDLVGVEAALLRAAEERADDDESILHTTLVFVVREERAAIPENARWLGAAETACLDGVAAVLGEVAAGRVPPGRAPWRDRAWLPTAEEWMVTSLGALGRPVCGPIEQVRMAELSCVLRAPTSTVTCTSRPRHGCRCSSTKAGSWRRCPTSIRSTSPRRLRPAPVSRHDCDLLRRRCHRRAPA
jgi:hypothetical protein